MRARHSADGHSARPRGVERLLWLDERDREPALGELVGRGEPADPAAEDSGLRGVGADEPLPRLPRGEDRVRPLRDPLERVRPRRPPPVPLSALAFLGDAEGDVDVALEEDDGGRERQGRVVGGPPLDLDPERPGAIDQGGRRALRVLPRRTGPVAKAGVGREVDPRRVELEGAVAELQEGDARWIEAVGVAEVERDPFARERALEPLPVARRGEPDAPVVIVVGGGAVDQDVLAVDREDAARGRERHPRHPPPLLRGERPAGVGEEPGGGDAGRARERELPAHLVILRLGDELVGVVVDHVDPVGADADVGARRGWS